MYNNASLQCSAYRMPDQEIQSRQMPDEKRRATVPQASTSHISKKLGEREGRKTLHAGERALKSFETHHRNVAATG